METNTSLERPKHSSVVFLCSVLLFLVTTGSISAQVEVKKQIYEAYISNKMASWERIMADFEHKAHSTGQYYDLLDFQYGYIGWCVGARLSSKAEMYLDKADVTVEKVLESEPRSSRAYAYKAAFYGFRIALSKFKAVYLGSKSMDCIEKALRLGPENPYAYIESGNADYYRPAAFGGSKSKAIVAYEKAMTLLEKNPVYLQYNWQYLSLLTILGKAYEETGNVGKAKAMYEKILKIEPDFLWVRDDLYPKLLKIKGS